MLAVNPLNIKKSYLYQLRPDAWFLEHDVTIGWDYLPFRNDTNILEIQQFSIGVCFMLNKITNEVKSWCNCFPLCKLYILHKQCKRSDLQDLKDLFNGQLNYCLLKHIVIIIFYYLFGCCTAKALFTIFCTLYVDIAQKIYKHRKDFLFDFIDSAKW